MLYASGHLIYSRKLSVICAILDEDAVWTKQIVQINSH